MSRSIRAGLMVDDGCNVRTWRFQSGLRHLRVLIEIQSTSHSPRTCTYLTSSDEEKSRSRHKDKKSRKSRSRKYSDTESSDSEYERRRRRRKEKQRRAKRYDDESSDDARERKRHRSRSTKTRTQTRSLSPQSAEEAEGAWVEKGAEGVLVPSKKNVKVSGGNASDDDEIGPRLPSEAEIKARKAQYVHNSICLATHQFAALKE